MKKGVIGIDLRACMESILRGEVSVDDIKIIYDDKIQSNNDNKYEDFLRISYRNFAWAMAKEELGQGASSESISVRTDELLPQLEQKAREVLKCLVENNKICEFRYKIPEGQPEEVIYAREEEITKIVENKDNQYVFRVNGKNYNLPGNRIMLGLIANRDKHIWYNNELELVAELLKYGDRIYDMSFQGQLQSANASMAMVMFPQYKEAIKKIIKEKEQIASKIKYTHHSESLPGMDYNGILQRLEDLTKAKKAHTSTEIGEGISDIRLDEFNKGLKDIIEGDKTVEQDTPTYE